MIQAISAKAFVHCLLFSIADSNLIRLDLQEKFQIFVGAQLQVILTIERLTENTITFKEIANIRLCERSEITNLLLQLR